MYSVDGNEPIIYLYPEYEKPIPIDSSVTIKAAVFDFRTEEKLGNTFTQKINLHKAVGAKISLNVAPNKAYNAGGKQALINGISGNNKRYGDAEWLGFSGDDVEIIIEFDEPTEVNSISTRFYNGNGQWIYAPKSMAARITLEKDDVIANKFIIQDESETNTIPVFLKFKTQSKMVARKIKLIIPNYGIIPEGKQGAGHKAWTFIDEIIVE
jgi:hexosaminidase